MNVGELKKFLESHPDDMPIIYRLHSDYEALEAHDIDIVSGVDKGHYIMRGHETMSDENKKKARKYLCFPGN